MLMSAADEAKLERLEAAVVQLAAAMARERASGATQHRAGGDREGADFDDLFAGPSDDAGRRDQQRLEAVLLDLADAMSRLNATVAKLAERLDQHQPDRDFREQHFRQPGSTWRTTAQRTDTDAYVTLLVKYDVLEAKYKELLGRL